MLEDAASNATAGGSFAHPVERELARIFDEHGIEWQYEPRTFVLERDGRGAVCERPPAARREVGADGLADAAATDPNPRLDPAEEG